MAGLWLVWQCGWEKNYNGKNSVCYTWQVNKAGLGSCPLPVTVFQRVWGCRSPVKGGVNPALLSIIPDSAKGAALPSWTFQVLSQLLTKTHCNMECPCFRCEQIQQMIDFNKAGSKDSFLPDPSSRNLLSPEESPPVHTCCLQVTWDFADCFTCLKTKRARARTDTQALDTLAPGNCPIAIFLLPV